MVGTNRILIKVFCKSNYCGISLIDIWGSQLCSQQDFQTKEHLLRISTRKSKKMESREFHGAGMPERRYSQREQTFREAAIHRKPNHRPMAVTPAEKTYYGSSQGRHGRHKPIKISLEDAMDDLIGVLEQSMDFYADFKEEFNQEVDGIKPYVNATILSCLWACKISKSDNLRSHCHINRKQHLGNTQVEDPKPACGFRTTNKQIKRMFKVAIAAAEFLMSQKQTQQMNFDPQTASRIFEKLRSGYTDISAYLESASKRIKDLYALLTEMEMMTTFLKRNGARHQVLERSCRRDMRDREDCGAPNDDITEALSGGECT